MPGGIKIAVIFPESTVLINHQLGFRRKDDFVYYMLN